MRKSEDGINHKKQLAPSIKPALTKKYGVFYFIETNLISYINLY